MRNFVVLISAIATFVLAGSAVQAQAPYDITNCGEHTSKLTQAINAALTRLDQISAAPMNVYQQIRRNSFGDYSADPDSDRIFNAMLAANIFNTHAVLTGGPTISIWGDQPPVYPRPIFNCIPSSSDNIAVYRGNGKIDLYVDTFFNNPGIPLSEKYGTNAGSRVGCILHEMIHLMAGGGDDIELEDLKQTPSAIVLAEMNDSRTYINAENYEMFYMSFLF